MNRESYARDWSTNHQRKGYVPTVPADIERRAHHEPCFLCGQAHGCKHRKETA